MKHCPLCNEALVPGNGYTWDVCPQHGELTDDFLAKIKELPHFQKMVAYHEYKAAPIKAKPSCAMQNSVFYYGSTHAIIQDADIPIIGGLD